MKGHAGFLPLTQAFVRFPTGAIKGKNESAIAYQCAMLVSLTK